MTAFVHRPDASYGFVKHTWKECESLRPCQVDFTTNLIEKPNVRQSRGLVKTILRPVLLSDICQGGWYAAKCMQSRRSRSGLRGPRGQRQ